MFKICELWTVILWYELNPRVRCAFGNVLNVRLFFSEINVEELYEAETHSRSLKVLVVQT